MKSFSVILILLSFSKWACSQEVQGILLTTTNTLNPASAGQTKMYYYKNVIITELSYSRLHIYHKKGKTDSTATYHVNKLFVRKAEEDHGLVYDSLTALTGSRVHLDSIIISKAILQLENNKVYEKIIHEYKPAGNPKGNFETYIPVIKTGPEMADSINFYFTTDAALRNIPFTLSSFADSSHAAKLQKIEIIYHNPTREGKVAYSIDPMPVMNEKKMREFAREYLE